MLLWGATLIPWGSTLDGLDGHIAEIEGLFTAALAEHQRPVQTVTGAG